MDTENDALTHKLATLQIKYTGQDQSPIVIIIEAQYLPLMNTPLFKRIQQLCTISCVTVPYPLVELELFRPVHFI